MPKIVEAASRRQEIKKLSQLGRENLAPTH